jgi:hypothetical protein
MRIKLQLALPDLWTFLSALMKVWGLFRAL